MIVKTIPSSWLIEEDHRLDCGPFVKGSLEACKKIEGLHCHKDQLVDLTQDGLKGIYHVGQDKIVWVEDNVHGMPFLRSGDILKTSFSFQPYISRKQVSGNCLFQCPSSATLITRSGTIGKMVYARKEMEDMAVSQDVLKVVPNSSKVPPGYLFAFLNTKYGLPIVTGGTFGSIVVHIEANNIANLPVPRLGDVEKRAHNLIQRAADLRTEAEVEIKDASQRYLEAAGLKDISTNEWYSKSGKIGFVTSVSKISLRAMNYIPFNQQLAELVRSKSANWKTLGELTEPGTLRSGPRFKRIDSDEEFGFELIGQLECFNLRPSGRWIAKNHLPKDKLIFVPEGTTLIASHGCAEEYNLFGHCQFISGKRLKYAYSQDFYRVIAKENEIPRGALFAYLKSQLSHRILKGFQTGSIQQDFHPELISKMPVPLINFSEASNIDRIVREAHKKYDDAIDYEDEAISLVEKAIEEAAQ